ncbi:MAG: THUMP domain-containing protein [Promethearchaeota archaeon]
MKDFNLIISTGRDFEKQAETEVWFNLMALGDDKPLFYKSGASGLFLVKTQIEPLKLINYLRNIMQKKDPNYIQFIQKIYPITKVVPTNTEEIATAVLDLVKIHPYCQDPSSKFRISIRKRLKKVNTQDIINAIANKLNFGVSLKEYDWMIQIEVIGEMTGIAIIKDEDIFKPISEKQIKA